MTSLHHLQRHCCTWDSCYLAVITLFLKSMPLVKVQKNVDFTAFTALSRNFQIIYIFKSCKYSMCFVVQVCMDHAAHIYIWKVKNTESKRCIGSNQTIFATFEYIYFLKVSAMCSKICEIYVLLPKIYPQVDFLPPPPPPRLVCC